MNIDLTDLIDIVQALVDYMKDVNFTIGEHHFNLWWCIVSLGSLEVLSYIFYGVNFSTDTDEN